MSRSNALQVLQSLYSSDEEEICDVAENSTINTGRHSGEPVVNFPALNVPDSIRNFCTQFVEHVDEHDNPELHLGKIRSFPHERGNWVSCIYVPVHASHQLNFLWDQFASTLQSIANFHNCSDLHISLSKTLILRHHWIQLFVNDIRRSCKPLKSFVLNFEKVDVFLNEEKTRTFLGVRIGIGQEILMSLIKFIDTVLKEYNLPVYYENPSFHASICWCLGDKQETINTVLPTLQQIFDSAKIESSYVWNLFVDEFHCKIGNRLFKLELS